MASFESKWPFVYKDSWSGPQKPALDPPLFPLKQGYPNI